MRSSSLDGDHALLEVINARGLREGAALANHGDVEAFLDLGLDEDGCTLVAAIRKLLEYCVMVLLGVIATLEQHRHERLDLSPCVTRVVNMSL